MEIYNKVLSWNSHGRFVENTQPTVATQHNAQHLLQHLRIVLSVCKDEINNHFWKTTFG